MQRTLRSLKIIFMLIYSSFLSEGIALTSRRAHVLGEGTTNFYLQIWLTSEHMFG